MSTDDANIPAALEAGQQLAIAASKITEVAGIPVAILPTETKLDSLERILKAADERAGAPMRRKGTATHQELASFIDHVNRFKDEGSAIWADGHAVRVTALLNYHAAGAKGAPRWGDHRSVYACPLSAPWQLWTAKNEQQMGQDAFGQLLEDNMADLASPGEDEDDLPAPAKVIQVARQLIMRTKGAFERTVNPVTGEFSLINKLENEETSTKIPRAFLLKLPVFEGGALYRVEARLRFSMPNGRPSFAFSLYQADLIKRDAFGGVRKEVAEKTGLPVFAGAPEA